MTPDDAHRLDAFDRQVLYALMTDARAAATSVAEEASVSGATVRNRYLCNASAPERETVVRPDDTVTVLSRHPSDERALDPFRARPQDGAVVG